MLHTILGPEYKIIDFIDRKFENYSRQNLIKIISKYEHYLYLFFVIGLNGCEHTKSKGASLYTAENAFNIGYLYEI